MARGSIYKRGDSWSVSYDLPRGLDGRRRQRSKSGFRTRKAAETWLRDTVQQIETGQHIEPSRLTVREFLHRWMEESAGPRLSPASREAYTRAIEQHISPLLGDRPLLRLSPLDISAWVNDRRTRGRKDGTGGLSANTQLQHWMILKGALGQAVRWGLIPYNPCDRTDPPVRSRERRKIPGVEVGKQLLEAAEGSWLHLPIALALYTGMRKGEILALRWEDVTLEPLPGKGALRIERSLQPQSPPAPDPVRIRPPKTEQGFRSVPLRGWIVQLLVQHKAEQAQKRLLAGSLWQHRGLVLCRDDGRWVLPSTLYTQFKRLAERIGRPELTFHDLRHIHASMLLGSGEPVHVVSARLGHASPVVTLAVYAHVLPGHGETAAEKIDWLFQGVG